MRRHGRELEDWGKDIRTGLVGEDDVGLIGHVIEEREQRGGGVRRHFA